MFQTKILTGIWATDTMDGRVKDLDRNQYSHVFYNGTYFSEIYPIDKKSDAGQTLQMFVMELGVPEELMVDKSKGQNSSGTEFMNPIFCLLYYFLEPYSFPPTLYTPYHRTKTRIPMVMDEIIIPNEWKGKSEYPIPGDCQP